VPHERATLDMMAAAVLPPAAAHCAPPLQGQWLSGMCGPQRLASNGLQPCEGPVVRPAVSPQNARALSRQPYLDAAPLHEERSRRRSRTPMQPAPAPPRHVSPHTVQHTPPHSLLTQAHGPAAPPPPAVAVPPPPPPVPEPLVPPPGVGAVEVELEAGSMVRIGDAICRITAPLGMGSFGVVWAAECDGIGEVAVKEIICQSQTDLSRAVYEAQLLRVLGGCATSVRDDDGGPRIPSYVASDMAVVSPEACRVRLAMSRLAGEPLDKFLRDHRARLDAQAEADAGGGEPPPRGRPLQQACEACFYARLLVEQLVPTMTQIATLSYHRDVNAHNILVDVDGPEPRYGLVDFGLAVDAARWRGGAEADVRSGQGGDWQHLDVGGDCRYWPASAWLQFEVGCYELATAAPLCLEYQTHLDLQGLGITALQVFAEMLPSEPSACPTSPPSFSVDTTAAELDNFDYHVPQELFKLQTAWEQYWDTASRFWAALLDTFRSNGDWNVLKNEFISMGVHEVIARKLRALRMALRDAEEACARAPRAAGLADAQALWASLLVMISSGEERFGPTNWEAVSTALRPCADMAPTAEPVLRRPSVVSVEPSFQSTSTRPAVTSGSGSTLPTPWGEEEPLTLTADAAADAGRSPPAPSAHRRACHAEEVTDAAAPPSAPSRAAAPAATGGTSTEAAAAGRGEAATAPASAAASGGGVIGFGNAASDEGRNLARADATSSCLEPTHTAVEVCPAASPCWPTVPPQVPSLPCVTSPRTMPQSASSTDEVQSSSTFTCETASRTVGSYTLTPELIPVGQQQDFFLRLSGLASKVVQLAQAMEKLELKDRDLAAAAAERLCGGRTSVAAG